jgi:ATP-dependent DNA ligase
MQIVERRICAFGWLRRALDTIGATVCRLLNTRRSLQPTALASLRQWRCGVPWLVGKSPPYNVLQNYNHADTPLQFYAFDLLHLAGKNLRDRPLEDRRALLRAKVMLRMQGQVLFSDTLEAPAADIVAAVKKQGLEGMIAKRRDSRYEPGRRSGAWVKMRINKGQELVIGGYVPAPMNFDSIVVGYYERDDLIYVARVRAGFVPALRAKVFERLLKLEIKTCP